MQLLRGSWRRESAFSRGNELGSWQLLVILCKYQLCITCAFVQRFLDTSLLSGNCALFEVTGGGYPEQGARGGAT